MDIGVHVVHTSCEIITYILESLSSLTQITHTLQVTITGFPQTSLEKFQWFFNDIWRQKSQISMTILNVTKWKKHWTTCSAWSSHTSYDHYWVFLRKSAKSSFSIWLTGYQWIMYMQNTYLFTHVASQNYVYFRIQWFFMSNWSKIQWSFHDFLIFTNFKNFSWNSMIFPWSWKRSEFQWFFKSCGNPELTWLNKKK